MSQPFQCGLYRTPADATLELKSMERKRNDKTMGFITVQLIADNITQTGLMAVSNARQDVDKSDIVKSAGAMNSKPMQAVQVGINADQSQSNILNGLKAVVSKLNVFVQIVDKSSKVSRQRRRLGLLVLTVGSQVHPYASFAWQVMSSLYRVYLLFLILCLTCLTNRTNLGRQHAAGERPKTCRSRNNYGGCLLVCRRNPVTPQQSPVPRRHHHQNIHTDS
jgi:hypothetical protein